MWTLKQIIYKNNNSKEYNLRNTTTRPQILNLFIPIVGTEFYNNVTSQKMAQQKDE